jgi:hypothetical protein
MSILFRGCGWWESARASQLNNRRRSESRWVYRGLGFRTFQEYT